MADKIQLGVDVDSRSVLQAEKANVGLARAVGGLKKEYDGLAKSSDRAEKELKDTARASTMADRAVMSTSRSLQSMVGGMRGVAGLGGAVRAALSAFVGAAVVRGLMDTAMQMQRINMTLQAVTGSSDAAAAEFNYISETADKFGQSILVSAGAYSKLLAASNAAGIGLQDSRNIFEGLTAAATTFGLGQYELEGALNAVQQMISKGSVQAEELRGQLGERLPGAFAIAADSMQMTTAELNKALELGLVSAEKFVQAFGPELQRRFSGIAESSDSAVKKLNELDNAFLKMKLTIIDSGFLEALTSTILKLTEFIQLDPVIAVAKGIGNAFAFMANHVVIAATMIGGMAVAFGWVSPVVAAIGAVVVALGALSLKTVEINGQLVSFGDIAGRTFRNLRNEVVTNVDEMREANRTWAAEHPGMAKAIATAFDLIMTGIKAVSAGYAAMGAFTRTVLSTMRDNATTVATNIMTVFSNLGSALTDIWAGIIARDWGAITEAAGRNLIGNMAPLADAGAAGGAAFTEAFEREINKPIFIQTETGLVGAVQKATAQLGQEADAANDKLEKLNGLQNMRLKHVKETGTAEAAVTKELEKGGRAAKGAADSAKDLRRETERADDAARELTGTWEKLLGKVIETSKGIEVIPGSIGTAIGSLAGGAGGMLGDTIKTALGGIQETLAEPLAKEVSEKITYALKNISMPNIFGTGAAATMTMQGVGAGLAGAAIGAMEGSAPSIGAGIGSAAGAVLGSRIGMIGGPLGSVLGAAIGGIAGQIFGGGDDDDKWKRTSGTAFTGTTFEQTVTTQRTMNTKTDQGFSPEGRYAFQATRALLADFNAELTEYVESIGGTMRRGVNLAVDQTAALKAITGAMQEGEIVYKGAAGKTAGEEISKRVAEVMAIAGEIVTSAGPPLTQAQQLWREAQKRFGAENVAILRDLGFTVAEIMAVKNQIRTDLREGFNKSLLEGLAQSGKATAQQLKMWRDAQFSDLAKGRAQAMATAREIGGSTTLVAAAFGVKAQEIAEQYREFLEDITDTNEKVIYTFMDRVRFRLDVTSQTVGAGMVTPEIARLQRYDQMQVLLEQRKALIDQAKRMGLRNLDFIANWFDASRDKINRDFKALIDGLVKTVEKKELVVSDGQRAVVQQAETMVEGLRNAAKGLAEVRASLRSGQQSPLGLQGRLAEARRQFTGAVGRARGGDLGAAGEVGQLAQTVLGLGQQVYGSSSVYANLFAAINATLGSLGANLTGKAKTLEQKLQEDILKGVTKQTDIQRAGFVELARKLDGVIAALDRQARANKVANARANVA